WLLPLSSAWQRMIILSAMLPPAVLNFLLSEHFNASPQAVASIVLVGNVLSVAVIPLVIWFTLTSILTPVHLTIKKRLSRLIIKLRRFHLNRLTTRSFD